MVVVPLAITQPIWANLCKFGENYVKLNPLEGFATTYIKHDSPAAFPACLDFSNNPLHNLSKGHTENSTFHHCVISFGVVAGSKINGLRNIEQLELDNNCLILTGTIETWYELIVKKLTKHGNSSLRVLLCHVLLHLEKIGFREMFIKFDKIKVSEDLYYIKEV